MTPKEKAYQLWNKYVQAEIVTEGKYSNYRGLTTEHSKVCAIIAIEEVLKYSKGHGFIALTEEYQQIKKEIEKL